MYIPILQTKMMNSQLLFEIIDSVKTDFDAIFALHYTIHNLKITDTNSIYFHLINSNKTFWKYINRLFLNSKIGVQDVIIHNLMLLLLELYTKTRDFKVYLKNEEIQGDFLNKWDNIDTILIEQDGKYLISETKLIEYFLECDTNISYLFLSLNTFIVKMSRLENLNQNLHKMKMT